jgi:hypothetical protein
MGTGLGIGAERERVAGGRWERTGRLKRRRERTMIAARSAQRKPHAKGFQRTENRVKSFV